MSVANDAIGGVPTFKYFNFQPLGILGRGGPVRYFFLSNNIKYEEIRVDFFNEWPQLKPELVATGESPAGHLPLVYINDKILYEHHAVMRRFSRQLGIYGVDIERDYLADQVAEELISWRADWVPAVVGGEEAKSLYLKEKRERWYKLLSVLLERSGGKGKYFVGDAPSFVDALAYGQLQDDQVLGSELLKEYPNLSEFFGAYGQIPSVKEFNDSYFAK